MKKTMMTMQLSGSSVELRGSNETLFEVETKKPGFGFGVIYTFDKNQLLQALNKYHLETDKLRAKVGAPCSA